MLVALVGAWALSDRRFPPETITATGPRVKDGDTLVLNGAAYRIDGIDAPEYRQLCKDSAGVDWPCGKAARSQLAAFATGQVTCVSAGEDRYGRKLATCRSTTALDIGEAMTASGFAVSNGTYEKAQDSARAAKRGIWAGTFTTPAEWREANPRKDAP